RPARGSVHVRPTRRNAHRKPRQHGAEERASASFWSWAAAVRFELPLLDLSPCTPWAERVSVRALAARGRGAPCARHATEPVDHVQELYVCSEKLVNTTRRSQAFGFVSSCLPWGAQARSRPGVTRRSRPSWRAREALQAPLSRSPIIPRVRAGSSGPS